MGERAKKKRAEEARAAKRAKKATEQATQLAEAPDPTSSNIATGSNVRSSKKPATVPRVPSGVQSVSTRQSTRLLGSSSTLGSGKMRTSANLETNNEKTRPQRSTMAAATALLKEIQFSDDEEADRDPEGVFTGNDENDMIMELDEDEDDDLDDEGSDDGSDVEVIEDPVAPETRKGKASAARKKPLTKPQAIDEESEDSSSDEFEFFEMTFEINDKARGVRKNITMPSFTSWENLKDKVARVFNIHPGSLQLQYRFSNKKANTLPFDLVSLDDYNEMRSQLKPLVVLKILASGKYSKSARKLIMVQLFDKGMEGMPASGEKGIKKSSKAPVTIGVDTSTTKQDELFEKKKIIIQQLTDHWQCELHSLPDKPALCWKPIEQRPHGDCYNITQSNINFWASCIAWEPTAFSVEEKPRQLNLLNNGPRRHGSSTNHIAQAQPAFPMPYGFYPPPNPFVANPMQWPGASFPQPPGPQSYGVPPANTTAPLRHVRGPRISDWLQYCDRIPGRDGEFFFGLADKFDRQGYRTIDQLTSSRMSVENLSSWLEIGKGTADLIIQYAEEDMGLVRDGKFTMEQDDGGGELEIYV